MNSENRQVAWMVVGMSLIIFIAFLLTDKPRDDNNINNEVVISCLYDKIYIVKREEVFYYDGRVKFTANGKMITCSNFIVEEK